MLHSDSNEAPLADQQLDRRVEELNRALQEVTEAQEETALFGIALHSALEVIGCSRGWISIINVRTGALETISTQGQGEPTIRSLMLGEGISGRALQSKRAYRVDDVSFEPSYEGFWKDTHSALAVPLLIHNAEVRIGHEVRRGQKDIGVLTVESSVAGAFTVLDEACLVILARHAAMVFDRLETDRKNAALDKTKREILQGANFDQTIHIVLAAITNALGYDFVNISLVDQTHGRIKSKYSAGLSEESREIFARLTDYPLNGADIHADIVRSGKIEVPHEDDPRFDPRIYEAFGHGQLIRVFVPMISPFGNRVIGTVEAGYRRNIRPHIYERDVQILNDFVAFVTIALEQRRDDVLERIIHELRAPAAAIRSDISFLRRRFKELPGDKILHRLDDLSMDAELVLSQVSHVEHFLNGSLPSSVPQRTYVFRDVILKTINQLRPRIIESGYDPTKIRYNPEDIGKVILYLDRAKLSEVVYNLLTNSIKYAEDDPVEFAIAISLAETHDQFVIKFKDWGIGINEEYGERIFEQGFRAPEANAMTVTGSGLGLTIGREIMKELGGDLRLVNSYKPTEFHLVLPKSLQEKPR